MKIFAQSEKYFLVILSIVTLLTSSTQRSPAQSTQPTAKIKTEFAKPAVYEFHTKWCKPCRTFNPLFKSVMERHKSEVDIFILDSEDAANAAVVEKFAIRAWPTVVFVDRRGHIISKCMGIISESELEKRVSALLLQRSPSTAKQ